MESILDYLFFLLGVGYLVNSLVVFSPFYHYSTIKLYELKILNKNFHGLKEVECPNLKNGNNIFIFSYYKIVKEDNTSKIKEQCFILDR